MLRLLYLGNLGLAHDVPLLQDFLRAARRCGEVSLIFFGTAENSLRDLRAFALREGIQLDTRPHVDFARLREVLGPMGFDFGVVTLAEEFVGLLSPSKFAGYLVLDLPVIYLGPADTNVGLVCDRFGAGVRFDRAALRLTESAEALTGLFATQNANRFAAGVQAARAYFGGFNGEHLAREILRRTNPR